MRRFLFAALICFSANGANHAAADDVRVVKRDVYDLPTPVAIQGRTNNIDQSLALNIGYIPSDSFNRGFPVSFSYAYYFRPYLAWEVASFSYNFNRETKIKKDVQDLGVATQSIGIGGQLDFPQSILLTGIVYSPLYGKSLMFNKKLVHSETSLFVGVGAMQLSLGGSVAVIAPGVQGRYFLTPKSALRFYLRQYMFNDKASGVSGVTDLGVGYEIQFGFFSRSSSDEDDS